MKDKLTTWLYWVGMNQKYTVVNGLAQFNYLTKICFWLIDKIDPEFSDGG